MRFLKIICSLIMITLFLNLHLPRVTWADEEPSFAKQGQAEENKVSHHLPEFQGTPEEEIPSLQVKTISAWKTLLVVGVVGVVGGAAAALSSGGGGGGGSSDDDDGGGDGGGDGGSEGSITVGW